MTDDDVCRCRLCLALLHAIIEAEGKRVEQRRRLALVKGAKRRRAA